MNIFGNGSDGDCVITKDTDFAGSVKQFHNLTINPGVRVYDSTGILKLKVSGTLTLHGSIDQTGCGGFGGAGGIGKVGTQGVGLYGIGGAGGKGHAGFVGASSVKYLTGSMNLLMLDLDIFAPTTEPIKFGCGGCGGGAGDPKCFGGAGGNGGAGGGLAIILACKIVGRGTIKANGSNGSAGSAGQQQNFGSSGGGGGGGAGGAIICYYTQFDESIRLEASGGLGGSRGNSSNGLFGAVGKDGTAGIIIKRYC
ncbi:hypothetical protein [Bacteroides sp.]|uniref:hypothetical protein n=1 Tax=Bacteroides sp. TaxID=29523 RepID=UPI00262DADA3|nr:hypothetical protein [Bacteroides sp.]MDD3039590.1 hypothetical protein [Bacteroides sp.]